MDYEEQTRRLVEALRAWVERERRELERTGERPSQVFLRRARVLEYVEEPDFVEAVRELRRRSNGATIGGSQEPY